MATVRPAGASISNSAAKPANPSAECHTCRQVTNYSPNLWMCVGNSGGSFGRKTGQSGNRRSDVVWATDGSDGSKQNAGYIGDPFGYNRLAPVNAKGQPISVPGSTLVNDSAVCLPPFSQVTVDLHNSADDRPNNLIAVLPPFDRTDPINDPGRYITLFANGSSSCVRNLGTCPTNQNTTFQQVGGENRKASVRDNHDNADDNGKPNDCDDMQKNLVTQPTDTAAPRNFTYGAFDTSPGTSQFGQGWQNRQSILSLSPGLGAQWQGSRYLEEDGGFGCNGGCHGRYWGC